MHMLDLVTDIVMASSSSQMKISEPFRTEDLSKMDFFDFVTGSAPDMAITSSSGGSGGNTSNGGGASVAMPGGNSGNTSSSGRTLSSALPGMTGTTVTDRPPGGRTGGENEGTTMDVSRGQPNASNTGPVPDSNDQPLQGFDQFWGSDKDPNRLDPAMFEDLNRYCWIQQNNKQHSFFWLIREFIFCMGF